MSSEDGDVEPSTILHEHRDRVHQESPVDVDAGVGEVHPISFAKALQERILNIYVSRCGGKTTKEYLREHWARKDWWLDANEILEIGLADEIG